MSKKVLPWVFVGVAWLVACMCIFGIVDKSITLTHARSHADLLLLRIHVLEYLVSNGMKGETRSRILEIVREKYQDDRIFSKGDNGLVVDGVEFIFRDGILIGVVSD